MSDFEVPGQSRPDAGGQPALAGMRVRYAPGPLRKADLPGSPYDAFRRWLADATAAGLPEPNAMVLATLARYEGNQSRAARHLGLTESGLRYKLSRWRKEETSE